MTGKRRDPASLRSARWFAPDDLRAFGHRSRAMQMGYAPEEWKGRPVIAILNTWSDAQPCHMHFKTRVDDVKRGILLAGGFPMELPALSLSESFLKPTTMLYRNLLDIPAVFAGLLTVIVIGLIVENLIFRTIERNTVQKWGLQS